MLEDAINNLTQAINQLNAILENAQAASPVQPSAPTSYPSAPAEAAPAEAAPAKAAKATAQTAPAKPAKPAKAAKATAPEPKEPSLDDLLGEDDDEQDKPEEKAVTNEDVQALCFSMIRKDREKYRKAIKDTILSFGVETIDKLDADQLKDCFLKLTALSTAA